MNPMKQIRIAKVTLNMGVGEAGDKLDNAVKILEIISGAKPVRTSSNRRIPTWGVRPNLTIACKVTIRGKKAEELLAKLFESLDNQISIKKFDQRGNFSFGVKEYIDIPGVEYDVEIGMYGLDVAVTLCRPGYAIKDKKLSSKVGKAHIITREEAVQFIKEKYSIEVSQK
jgi:large subunit ribosomal protein L5